MTGKFKLSAEEIKMLNRLKVKSGMSDREAYTSIGDTLKAVKKSTISSIIKDKYKEKHKLENFKDEFNKMIRGEQ